MRWFIIVLMCSARKFYQIHELMNYELVCNLSVSLSNTDVTFDWSIDWLIGERHDFAVSSCIYRNRLFTQVTYLINPPWVNIWHFSFVHIDVWPMDSKWLIIVKYIRLESYATSGSNFCPITFSSGILFI